MQPDLNLSFKFFNLDSQIPEAGALTGSAEWLDSVKKKLGSLDVRPSEILEVLSRNPFLKNCFSKDAGVAEGYTVGQHTEMVLEAAQEFRESLQRDLNDIVTWEEFLLFLALHDIGKGIAKDNQSEAFGSSLSFKESELKTTQKILKQVMTLFGMPAHKIQLFCQMLEYDTQGLYLKGDIHHDEAFDNIIEMAKKCGMAPSDFYKIFCAFHMVDAASYPALRSIFAIEGNSIKYRDDNQSKVNKIRESLDQAGLGKVRFDELLDKINRGESPKFVQEKFMDFLPELLKFLLKTHKEMLGSSEDNSQHEKEVYRKIKRGFRDILLYCAKGKEISKELKDNYDNWISQSLGRKEFHCIQEGINKSLFFNNVKLDNANIIELDNFFDELMNFRKNFLCRFSVEKVERFIRKELDKIAEETVKVNSFGYTMQDMVEKVKQDPVKMNKNLVDLLKITYLHGSNAGILPNLLKTGMQLMSSGRLFRAGVVPFSGELREGSTATGINQHRISGTSLDDGKRAYQYAVNAGFHTVEVDEVQRIETFLNRIEQGISNSPTLFQNIYDTTGSGSWQRVSAAILRLRCLDPEKYQGFENRLRNCIEKMENDWNDYKKSENYLKNMPKEEDPTGALGYKYHDYYWWGHFKRTEGCIESLKKAVNDKIIAPKGIAEALKNPYGMVFGSISIHTTCPYLQSASERCAQKASSLGRDIQMIFVHSNDQEHLAAYLKEHGLAEKVSLVDIEKLPQAILLNQLASPYFCDLASSKKLGKLVTETNIE